MAKWMNASELIMSVQLSQPFTMTIPVISPFLEVYFLFDSA